MTHYILLQSDLYISTDIVDVQYELLWKYVVAATEIDNELVEDSLAVYYCLDFILFYEFPLRMDSASSLFLNLSKIVIDVPCIVVCFMALYPLVFCCHLVAWSTMRYSEGGFEAAGLINTKELWLLVYVWLHFLRKIIDFLRSWELFRIGGAVGGVWWLPGLLYGILVVVMFVLAVAIVGVIWYQSRYYVVLSVIDKHRVIFSRLL